MPNHITNLLTITGEAEKVAAFRATHVRENEHGHTCLDFGTIVPVPQCVTDTMRASGVAGDAEVTMYARALLEYRGGYVVERHPGLPADVRTWGDLIGWLETVRPGIAQWGRAALRCAAETGYPGWYEWSCANWGTKWGSYEYKERSHEPGRFVFEFQTAWSPPRPIFEKLTELWPELTIEIEAIDEGGREYEGRYHGAERTLAQVDEDPERYRRVYGRAPDADEDDEELIAAEGA